MSKLKSAIDFALTSIPPTHRTILRLHMLGASVKEIQKETGLSEGYIRHVFSNPKVRREMERLEAKIDEEILRLRKATLRKIQEAALEAVDAILIEMRNSNRGRDRIFSAIKVLEYTLGKPKQPIEPITNRLNEEDLRLLEKGLTKE